MLRAAFAIGLAWVSLPLNGAEHTSDDYLDLQPRHAVERVYRRAAVRAIEKYVGRAMDARGWLDLGGMQFRPWSFDLERDTHAGDPLEPFTDETLVSAVAKPYAFSSEATRRFSIPFRDCQSRVDSFAVIVRDVNDPTFLATVVRKKNIDHPTTRVARAVCTMALQFQLELLDRKLDILERNGR